MISSLPSDLESQLAKAPEDWSIRIRLIEVEIRRGDMEAARRLVRLSPDESPLPPELQFRLHTLMVHGVEGFALLGEAEERIDSVSEKEPNGSLLNRESDRSSQVEFVSDNRDPVESSGDPSERVPSIASTKSASHHPQPVPPKRDDSTSPSITAEETGKSPVKISQPKATSSSGWGTLKLNLKDLHEKGAEKWDDYEGDLVLEPAVTVKVRQRQVQFAQRVSAFSVALLGHFIFLLVVGFIVIAVPRPNPPTLVATVVPVEREIMFVPPKVTRANEIKPAAASAAPPNVIGALAMSPVSIPEMEQTNSVDVTNLITGMAPMGEGLNFTGDAREISNVNFFGISAGGKRIVFIIDATREMLVDEKGGMFAYDKVKDEIGVMLAGLNRATRFNILLYEGGTLKAFAEEPVVAMPSSLRMAIEWLQPLNRNYDDLGLRSQPGEILDVAGDIEPIPGRDVAHYTKAIQKAIEWQASTVFCISGGYRRMGRSLSPEEMEKFMMDRERNPGTPGTVDPRDRQAWNDAQQKTRDWLNRENSARAEKGLPPKVVLNFNQLVREITGATPPQASGGTPGASMPRTEPYTPEDIEALVRNGVKDHFGGVGMDPPSLHMVVFLGEDEPMDDQTKDHFQNLTRKNNGKFKLLHGLAGLADVTAKK